MTPTLFLDRDGTLIEEPPDEQVDRLDKLALMPGVVPALLRLRSAGYRLVMISNQDGLGSNRFPLESFRVPHEYLLGLLASQGIDFAGVLICPHQAQDRCDCRKPATRLAAEWISGHPIDPELSAVLGDRDSDLELARRLGIAGYRISRNGSAEQHWPAVSELLCRRRHRLGRVERRTRETAISVAVDLDSESPIEVTTGIGFFDHMLEQIARHGGFALELQAHGDLEVDEHHTVEDCALALGAALRQALGDKHGIARYGFLLPMDEALARVALDLSGRSYSAFSGRFAREAVGGLPTELVPHFFRSLADALGATLHLEVSGENTHHMVEACFKAVGRALAQAMHRSRSELPSTKGVL
jgi:imidazoleglycerol-phosphate dehydratase / histidinol-phosphatase